MYEMRSQGFVTINDVTSPEDVVYGVERSGTSLLTAAATVPRTLVRLHTVIRTQPLGFSASLPLSLSVSEPVSLSLTLSASPLPSPSLCLFFSASEPLSLSLPLSASLSQHPSLCPPLYASLSMPPSLCLDMPPSLCLPLCASRTEHILCARCLLQGVVKHVIGS